MDSKLEPDEDKRRSPGFLPSSTSSHEASISCVQERDTPSLGDAGSDEGVEKKGVLDVDELKGNKVEAIHQNQERSRSDKNATPGLGAPDLSLKTFKISRTNGEYISIIESSIHKIILGGIMERKKGKFRIRHGKLERVTRSPSLDSCGGCAIKNSNIYSIDAIYIFGDHSRGFSVAVPTLRSCVPVGSFQIVRHRPSSIIYTQHGTPKHHAQKHDTQFLEKVQQGFKY